MKIVVMDGHALDPGDLGWQGFEALGEFEYYARPPPQLILPRMAGAGAVLVNKTPIMGSREVDDGSVRSEDLAALIPGCVTVAGLKEAADYIKANAEPGDLALTLGCGDVYKAARMMLQ